MTTMFSGASNFAESVDRAFIFIFAISFIFTIGITVAMIYIVIHFSRKKNKNPQQFSGNVPLEIIWTVVPLILVLFMFYYGWVAFAPMRKVPQNSMQVKVIGRMWSWSFDYGNGKISPDLVVPLDRNVKLNLFSEDVNHGLFIPAFRVKEDVIPGYNNYLWFQPIAKGKYDIYCTEYCGLAHSAMVAKAIVVDSLEFKTWLADLKVVSNDDPGMAILKANACITCHSIDGTKVIGPSFKGLYGAKRMVLTDQGEKEVEANADYIKRAIIDPNGEIVKGYNKGLMQSYKDVLKAEDIDKIVDYFKKASEQK
ncbi:MAG: cytochrome c oxidase subunit II [Bacteroidia bacterium]|nr:cytochrome c oxidase subunit II [Bacteroidia bacterium]